MLTQISFSFQNHETPMYPFYLKSLVKNNLLFDNRKAKKGIKGRWLFTEYEVLIL